MNKSKERNDVHLPRSTKHPHSSTKVKALRNAKSGVIISDTKLEKTKISNQSYYRKTTLHSRTKPMEESNHSKVRAQPKHLKSSRNLEEHHRLTKRLMSASSDPRKMLQTLRSTSPSLEIISAQLELKKGEKSVRRREQNLLDKLTEVLAEYKESLSRERKEKEYLQRQNRKLRERLHFQSSQKKIYPIHEYHL